MGRPVMKYFVPISMGRITAVLAANSVIGAMRNGSATTSIHIRRISATIGFDGVGNPDSAQFAFVRFSGANFTGGTAIVPAKADSVQPASVVTDARQSPSTALGQVGVAIEATPLIVTQNQRSTSATTSEVHLWARHDGPVLNPGEGLCILLPMASIVGDYISGTVSYDGP